MITITKLDASTKGSEYFIGEIRGLSTDTKPEKIGDINVGNGCQFIEMDTGKIYFYDLENKQWREF